MLKKPEVRLAVLGLALLGSSAAWYLIAPLFTGRQAYSVFPTLAVMVSPTARPAVETNLPTETPVPMLATVLSIGVDTQLVASGEFHNVAYSGSGSAQIRQLESGELVLSLQDFEVEAGPELRVFVTELEITDISTGIDMENSLDLGWLEALNGDQIYELPEDVDISRYQSVVIWCGPQRIAYIAATLEIFED